MYLARNCFSPYKYMIWRWVAQLSRVSKSMTCCWHKQSRSLSRADLQKARGGSNSLHKYLSWSTEKYFYFCMSSNPIATFRFRDEIPTKELLKPPSLNIARTWRSSSGGKLQNVYSKHFCDWVYVAGCSVKTKPPCISDLSGVQRRASVDIVPTHASAIPALFFNCWIEWNISSDATHWHLRPRDRSNKKMVILLLSTRRYIIITKTKWTRGG